VKEWEKSDAKETALKGVERRGTVEKKGTLDPKEGPQERKGALEEKKRKNHQT